MPLVRPNVEEGLIGGLIGGLMEGTSVHAYLFEGEAGLPTRETARYFAAALLCEGAGEPPCGMCESCVQAAGGNNPDLQSLSLSDITSKKSVGADEIRAVISDVYTKPFRAARKVYIIEDGDALTPQAQNAMLKILEEPPSYAVFIICVSNAELILPTVRSRSRIVRFTPKTDVQMAQYVKNTYPHMMDKLDFIVSFSAGIAGRADLLCSGGEAWELRRKAFDALRSLLLGADEEAVFSVGDVFEQQKKGKEGGMDSAALLLDFMLSFASDLLRLSNGIEQGIANRDLMEELRAVCARVSRTRLDHAARCILTAQQMLSRHVSRKAAVLWLAAGIFYGD